MGGHQIVTARVAIMSSLICRYRHHYWRRASISRLLHGSTTHRTPV